MQSPGSPGGAALRAVSVKRAPARSTVTPAAQSSRAPDATPTSACTTPRSTNSLYECDRYSDTAHAGAAAATATAAIAAVAKRSPTSCVVMVRMLAGRGNAAVGTPSCVIANAVLDLLSPRMNERHQAGPSSLRSSGRRRM